VPKYLIGIDGGGTKTEYLLSDLSGKILAQLTHAQTNLSVSGVGLAAFNLHEGIRQLLENHDHGEITVLVLALAGLDTNQDRNQVQEVLLQTFQTWPIKQLILVNDTMAALVNGTLAKQAVVLIGGTGSNCFGYNHHRQHCFVGGLGHLLTDEGSGYDAGRLTLKAVAMAEDGRTCPSMLKDKVFTHFGVTQVSQLKEKVYNPPLTKAEIAALAKPTVKAMHEGDQLACVIINYCLKQLLLSVETIVRRLKLNHEFDLVVSGSFLLHLLPEFTQILQPALPQAKLIKITTRPVYGSLRIAQAILSGTSPQHFWYSH
jgi:N-acetylglucosamine kinase-like BadF-type ATPase